MFQATPYCEVFIMLNMFKKKRVVKIKNMTKVFQIIEYLIQKKSVFHIINYLTNAIEQNKEETIKHYNELIKKITKKKSTQFKVNDMYENVLSQFMNHVFSILELSHIKTKSKRLSLKQLPNKFIKYHNSLIEFENICSRNVLREKRHYEIDNVSGTFKLDRHSSRYNEFCDLFWYNWEFCSKETPFRKNKYDANIVMTWMSYREILAKKV